MALNRRKRILDGGYSKEFAEESGLTIKRTKPDGNIASMVATQWPRGFRGCQITDSEGHPWFPKKTRPEGDIGGPFKTRKVEVQSVSHAPVGGSRETPFVITSHVNGYAIPGPNDNVVDALGNLRTSAYPDLSSSTSVMNSLGATAISRCNPVNPVLDAATSFAEMSRDGLPSIIGLKALKDRRASSIGDEFLNIQFGIKPILTDLKALGTALQDREKILKQLRRDSGRLVRRSYEFPTTRELLSDTSGTGTCQTSMPSELFQTPAQYTGITRKQVFVERQRWFSGAFTYYLPDTDVAGGFSRMALEADKLFGLTPDIADVWNLIPWSWTVDWFVNVGPVLTNLSNMAKYGLVMPYGYMMETTIVTYQYTLTLTDPSGPLGRSVNLVIVDKTKQRVKATPFGFGVSWDGFDTTQLAILGALGLSRSPF